MAIPDKQESVMRTIRAMIARAEHPNTPKPEAEVAFNQAQKLMIRYAISQAQIDSELKGSYKTKPSSIDVHIPPPFVNQKITLLSGIAQIFTCRVVQHYRKADDGNSVLTIVGFESDTDITWTLFMSLYSQMVDDLYSEELGKTTTSFKKSFILGFCVTATDRLRELHKEEMVNSSTGSDLVLFNRSQEVDAKFEEMYPGVKTSKPLEFTDYRGMTMGNDSGEKADISITSDGGNFLEREESMGESTGRKVAHLL